MSHLSAPWWVNFVGSLRDRSLAALSAELQVPEAELLAALIEADRGGAAQEAPWWPEALRLRAFVSIRSLSRLFGTTPRRVRRGLARAGVRAGGIDLSGGAHRSLRRLREHLGHKTDREIAHMAGLIPEAVQGERRRLGIPAHRPRPRMRLSEADEEWIRGARPAKVVRTRNEPEVLAVVRRPTPRPPSPETVHVPVASAPAAAVPVAVTVHPTPVPVTVRHTPPVPVTVRTSLPPGPLSPGSLPPGPVNVPVDVRQTPVRIRDFFHSREPDDLAALLQPPRVRDGRQRIVRVDTPPRGMAVSLPPAPSPVTRPTVPPRVVSPPRPTPSAGAAPPRAAWPPVVPRLTPLPPPPSGSPAAAPAPSAVPPSPPVPDEAAATAEFTWHVVLPGEDAPMIVRAPDIARAVRVAAARLPWDILQQASIQRA